MLKTKKPLFPISCLDILFAILIGALSLAIYVRTLAPSLLYGDIAYRVNLMSAFFGALAAANAYLIVRLMGQLITMNVG
jgi:hypothetical protein